MTRTLGAVSIALAGLLSAGGCDHPRAVGAIDVPGDAQVLAMSVSRDTVFLGVAENPAGEVHVIDASTPRAPVLIDSIEVGASVRGIAERAGRLYLATSDDARELVVLDAATRTELGAFDLPAARGADAVALLPGVRPILVVVDTAVDPHGPDQFVVNATDPANMTLVLGQDESTPPAPAMTMQGYEAGGRIVARARGAADGALTLLAVDAPNAEFQIVAGLNDPLSISDVNGDGVIRLACLGDSNTAEGTRALSWCSHSRREIWHHRLEHQSRYARAGARLLPRPGTPIDGAEVQLRKAIAGGADHVILAFGTNDVAMPAQVLADKAVELRAVADAAGIGMWVALVPPRGPNAETGEIEAMNAALRAAFPPSELVDFYTGFTFDDMTRDRVHFTPAGRAKRGHVVAKRLLEGPPSRESVRTRRR